MKMMKQMACAALAAAVAVGITGCGSKADYSQPKVAEGTIAVLAGRSAQDTSLKPICEKYGLASNDLSKLPKEVKELVADLGLDKAESKWMAVTVGDVSAAVKGEDAPDVAVALATTLDLDKAIAACEKKIKEEKKDGEVSFKKTAVAGVDAYEVACKDCKVGAKAVVPCVASLDKQLILAATSAACLEKQIALYRDGKGASAEFGAFSLKANDLIRVKVAKVGENVKKNLPSPDMLQAVNSMLPDGDKLILGLGTAEIAVAASADGKNVALDVSLETAADADADKLVTLAKTGLMTLTAMVKGQAEKDADAKAAAAALEAAKIVAEGKVARLSASVDADAALKALAEKAKDIK